MDDNTSSDICKIVTLNVASLNASVKKGLFKYITDTQPDIICLQETKLHPNAKPPTPSYALEGYKAYFHHSVRRGYSGTAIYTKFEPVAVTIGFEDSEGRCIVAEFEKCIILNVYVPNAGDQLQRMRYKMDTWLPRLAVFIENQTKPVILLGDLNIAHNKIDIWDPEGHTKCAGFTPEERSWMDRFLLGGYTDIFRRLYPEAREYSFFGYRGHAREKNHGWRLDYFITQSANYLNLGIVDCQIESGQTLSDHVPVVLYAKRSDILGNPERVQSHSVVVLPN